MSTIDRIAPIGPSVGELIERGEGGHQLGPERGEAIALSGLERHQAGGAEFSALRAGFDDAQVLEIVMLCGFYRTVAYLVGGLDLPLEAGAPRFEAVRSPG
jgi:hypothetical protein